MDGAQSYKPLRPHEEQAVIFPLRSVLKGHGFSRAAKPADEWAVIPASICFERARLQPRRNAR